MYSNIIYALYDISQFLGPRPLGPFSTILAPQIFIIISHMLFMTFDNSSAQGLPAHFPQAGVPPNPYWNIVCPLYDICVGLKALRPLQILTEIAHILFVTFANSWALIKPLDPFSTIGGPSTSPLKYHTFSLWHLLVLEPKALCPIFHNLQAFQILLKISHILLVTFASSWAEGLPAHSPQF